MGKKYFANKVSMRLLEKKNNMQLLEECWLESITVLLSFLF